jgi:hypothetical protein
MKMLKPSREYFLKALYNKVATLESNDEKFDATLVYRLIGSKDHLGYDPNMENKKKDEFTCFRLDTREWKTYNVNNVEILEIKRP